MGKEVVIEEMRQAFDSQLRQCVDHPLVSASPFFKEILEYQLGWVGNDVSVATQGKRLRPLLVLLSTHAAGGDWTQSLPAAAAVELLHNFSLIHDDIQDQSPTRRGRQTVWVKWGVAQAINSGDAMLGVSNLALLELKQKFPSQVVVNATTLFQLTLVELTRGQYLDLAYEKVDDLSMDDYSMMIEGKTGALLSCCLELGVMLGGASTSQCVKAAQFGRLVGRAFQIQDDWLGIWGLDQETGKPGYSDLYERKKSYPILTGIRNKKKFADMWNQTSVIDPANSADFARQLEEEGIKEKTEHEFASTYAEARELLRKIDFADSRKLPLDHLVESILTRIK